MKKIGIVNNKGGVGKTTFEFIKDLINEKKIWMAFRPNKNDLRLLASIAEHKALTVKQLSALSQRSCQVIRRRVRILVNQDLITAKMQGYGHGRGRPADTVFLTEKGTTLLQEERILPSQVASMTDKTVNPFLVDHQLLVNWFRIHLLQIERTVPQLSVQHLSPSSYATTNRNVHPSLSEHIPAGNLLGKPFEFVPDGVFSITSEEPDKARTLLFFLEVDMGTETLASMDRNLGDLRQKILNYQALFRSGRYKRYEGIFGAKLNGFRLLFLVNTAPRLAGLCRLVQEMPPSDFIWLAHQESMFSHGLSGRIWARGGRNYDPPQSILGQMLSSEIPLLNEPYSGD
jgi:hypothetical protein